MGVTILVDVDRVSVVSVIVASSSSMGIGFAGGGLGGRSRLGLGKRCGTSGAMRLIAVWLSSSMPKNLTQQ